ncbi:MAG TPA: hypothetical protein VLX29_10040 [Nitrospirota bacterium]|nr:hypothetical protein [Nitrospirota bacterium]
MYFDDFKVRILSNAMVEQLDGPACMKNFLNGTGMFLVVAGGLPFVQNPITMGLITTIGFLDANLLCRLVHESYNKSLPITTAGSEMPLMMVHGYLISYFSIGREMELMINLSEFSKKTLDTDEL